MPAAAHRGIMLLPAAMVSAAIAMVTIAGGRAAMVATTMIATAVPATTGRRPAMVATTATTVPITARRRPAMVTTTATTVPITAMVMPAIAAAKHAYNGRASRNITWRAIVIPAGGGVITGRVAGGITSATTVTIRTIDAAREQRGCKQQGDKCAFHDNDIVRLVVAALGQDYSFPQAKKSGFSQPGLP